MNAERLEVRRVEPAMRRDPNRDDVIGDHRWCAAPNTVRVRRKVLGAELAPVAVIATLSSRRALGVAASLPRTLALGNQRAPLTGKVSEAAVTADASDAVRHDQATGRLRAPPLITVTAMGVPVPCVPEKSARSFT
jgi:hypothetical protein